MRYGYLRKNLKRRAVCSKRSEYTPGCKNRSEGIEQLLPWSDFIKEHCSGLIDVETVTVEEHPQLSI